MRLLLILGLAAPSLLLWNGPEPSEPRLAEPDPVQVSSHIVVKWDLRHASSDDVFPGLALKF